MVNGYLMRITSKLFIAFLCLVSPAMAEISIGRFDPRIPAVTEPWQLVRLEKQVPPTQYRSVNWDGVAAIEAQAQASMALLARPVSVDLAATPVLCWRWRVDHTVKMADMSKRRGDDYAARIYLAFSLPPDVLGLAARASLALARAVYGDVVPDAAINYVWDNRYPIGTRMPNAYTDRAQMIVRRSGNQHAGSWVSERVNVAEDVVRTFGTDRARLKVLAIAADADNTGESVRSGFADLHFVGADEGCRFEHHEG